MSGFDTNRIVGLDSRFAETIQCSICLLILNNPLMTKCGHNYCNQCIKEIVENGVKSCPDCRKAFTKKRPKESSDNSDVVFRRNRDVFVFSKNLKLNEIIGKLKISCDYESNGCKESVELESLSQHITRCEYRFCKTCGFRPIEESDEHNCIEVLKNMNNEWKEKYKESLQTNKELEENLSAEIHLKNRYFREYRNGFQIITELKTKLKEELRQKNEWKDNYESEAKLLNKYCVEKNTLKKYDLKINESHVLKCIESGEVDNHLIGVYNRTIDSKRRDIFDNESKQMSDLIRGHSPKFYFIYSINNHCLSLYGKNCHLGHIQCLHPTKRLQFFNDVWIPEAIVKAITIVYDCDWIRAEQLFNNYIN